MAAAAAAAVLTATPASAVVILGLYNTGVHNGGPGWAEGGGPKPGNGADLHWSATGGNGGRAFTGTPQSSWLDNDTTSQWLTLSPGGGDGEDDEGDAEGEHVFNLVFDLTGFDPSSATFDGRFLAGGEVTEIRLNGQVISGAGGSASSWADFESVPGAFVAAQNTLQFFLGGEDDDDGNPAGLRVEFLNSDVSALAAIPEPATWAMMIAGFGMVGMARRRRARRASYILS